MNEIDPKTGQPIVPNLELEEGDEGKGGKDGEGKGTRNNETPEATKARLDRQQERHKAKYPNLYNADGSEKGDQGDRQPNNNANDLAEKSFLIASGIKGKDEIALARKIATETGKPLDEVLETKYFQGELKELRDEVAAAAAMPQGTNRTGNPASDDVDYWLKKGELPPASNPDLRQKVVNARIKNESSGSQFTGQAVVK